MLRFSIITCVSNYDLYRSCVADSIELSDFGDYELISIDNTMGWYSAAAALNMGSKTAKGEILIFCHQDIKFPSNWLPIVNEQLLLISEKDLNWGVSGVMGVKNNGLFAGNIIDPHTTTKIGKLPCKVETLDEVCLIMRKSSALRFDESLGGFHLYGADICLQSRQLGLSCYAIDAPFEHLSKGKVDESFLKIAEKLKEKWSKIKGSPYVIETTCGVFRLKYGIFSNLYYHYKRQRRKLIRRLHKLYIKDNNDRRSVKALSISSDAGI